MTSAPHESPTVAAALALPRALERGVHGEALRSLYTPDAISIEHPNPVAPNGGTADVDHIIAASDAGAALLQSQRYDIRHVVESGDLVIFRYIWTGMVGVDRGPFNAGQKIVAHIAAFATIADGRIARFETYDCYEPLPS
jgi:ketosteroid isomerase-like protein